MRQKTSFLLVAACHHVGILEIILKHPAPDSQHSFIYYLIPSFNMNAPENNDSADVTETTEEEEEGQRNVFLDCNPFIFSRPLTSDL